MATSIKILDDEAFDLLQYVKSFRRQNPQAGRGALCGQVDENGQNVYSDEKIDLISEFWDAPASAYLKASDLSGAAARIQSFSDEVRRELADADAKGNAAIEGLSRKIEAQAEAGKEQSARQEQAYAEFKERQEALSSQIGEMIEALAARQHPAKEEHHGDDPGAGPSDPSPESSAGQEKKEPQDPEDQGQPEEDRADGDQEGGGAPAAQEQESQGSSPQDGSVPQDAGDPGEQHGSDGGACRKDPAAIGDGSGTAGDPPSAGRQDAPAGFGEVIAELKAVNASLSSLRGDVASLKTDFRELSESVKDMACVTPLPAEEKKNASADGSSEVIEGIVRETASSGMLASPLAVLQSSLRSYRDSFARRYAASMACLIAQDSEVSARFTRSADRSLQIIAGNSSDFRKGIAALAQDAPAADQAAPGPGMEKDPGEGKEKHE